MKLKIQIKSRWTGSVLFEYEKENNTVKDTLIEAVKNGADLRGADLGGADLRGADLGGAYLRDADLRGTDLRGADLVGAYLRDADLCGADLRGADLRGAYLRDADLVGADLVGAYLRDAKNIPFIPMACPSDGAFIGWKKIGRCLIKLEIPEDARRSSATGRKCRCDKAKVLAITDLEGNNPIEQIENKSYTPSILYKVGEMIYPDSFDEDRWNECSHGIHFFINRQEAVEYNG